MIRQTERVVCNGSYTVYNPSALLPTLIASCIVCLEEWGEKNVAMGENDREIRNGEFRKPTDEGTKWHDKKKLWN